MKVKFFLTSIVIQLSILNSYAANPGKDYLIRLTNDTIYGRIEIQSDIDFRTSLQFYDNNDKMTRYLPGDILAFYIEEDNRYFESKSILLNDMPNTVFLRCLVKGNVNLYLLREKEEENNRYFYQRGDYFTELLNTKVQKLINRKLYNTYNSEYVLTLKNELVNICQEELGTVDELKFDERNLAYYIDKINNCISKENQSKVYLVKKRVQLMTGISANFGKDKDWPAKGTSFGIGFYQESKIPEISRRFFFSYGLDLEYGFTEKDSTNNRNDYYKISMPLIFNFELNCQNVQPYFSAGFNFISYFKSKSSDVTGGSEFPITIGGGIKTKKLNLVLTTNIADTRLKLVYFLNKK